MGQQFEATGNMSAWPPNEHGKPTQAAVIGVHHPDKRERFVMLWSGKFPDLEPALYWAAKKEMEAVRKGKWTMASRVVWQHDLTPEQAVAHIAKEMGPQSEAMIRSYQRGDDDLDMGTGPMRPISPDEVKQQYVELVDSNNEDADPLASFIVDSDGGDPFGSPVEIPPEWLPKDPNNN